MGSFSGKTILDGLQKMLDEFGNQIHWREQVRFRCLEGAKDKVRRGSGRRLSRRARNGAVPRK